METLIGITITMLILTLLYSVWHTILAVTTGQQQRSSSAGSALLALDEISRDITCGLILPGASPEAMALTTETETDAGSSIIKFHCAAVPEQTADLEQYHIEQIVYQLIENNDEGPSLPFRLIRTCQPVRGPGTLTPPETNILSTSVTAFHIEAYDGTDWQASWTEEQTTAWPSALRISISYSENGQTGTCRTEQYIPAGNVITSSLSRTTSTAR
jgi:hypothetical protein